MAEADLVAATDPNEASWREWRLANALAEISVEFHRSISAFSVCYRKESLQIVGLRVYAVGAKSTSLPMKVALWKRGLSSTDAIRLFHIHPQLGMLFEFPYGDEVLLTDAISGTIEEQPDDSTVHLQLEISDGSTVEFAQERRNGIETAHKRIMKNLCL